MSRRQGTQVVGQKLHRHQLFWSHRSEQAILTLEDYEAQEEREFQWAENSQRLIGAFAARIRRWSAVIHYLEESWDNATPAARFDMVRQVQIEGHHAAAGILFVRADRTSELYLLGLAQRPDDASPVGSCFICEGLGKDLVQPGDDAYGEQLAGEEHVGLRRDGFWQWQGEGGRWGTLRGLLRAPTEWLMFDELHPPALASVPFDDQKFMSAPPMVYLRTSDLYMKPIWRRITRVGANDADSDHGEVRFSVSFTRDLQTDEWYGTRVPVGEECTFKVQLSCRSPWVPGVVDDNRPAVVVTDESTGELVTIEGIFEYAAWEKSRWVRDSDGTHYSVPQFCAWLKVPPWSLRGLDGPILWELPQQVAEKMFTMPECYENIQRECTCAVS